jgi:hypothetical protein
MKVSGRMIVSRRRLRRLRGRWEMSENLAISGRYGNHVVLAKDCLLDV